MCQAIVLADGTRAIVCGGHRSRKRCACGRPATLACDWKVPRTCDAAICDRCTTSPAPEKDLCPPHARAFEAWRVERRSAEAKS